MHSGSGAIRIVLYPEYSHAMYFDLSKNLNKKDYTHVKSVLDSAILTFNLSGGYIKVKRHRKNGLFFRHKTDLASRSGPGAQVPGC